MKRRDKKKTDDVVNDTDERALFLDAMRNVTPLPASDRVVHADKHIQPIPCQTDCSEHSEQLLMDDSLPIDISLEIEIGDAWSFLRPGLSRQTLRRLRRGYWGIQANLDLHGLTRDEAKPELITFLHDSYIKHFRCVRVIHGKGLSSKNQEPVLKTRIGSWLAEYHHVLAFCQAKPKDGGGGAVLVLLKGPIVENRIRALSPGPV
ncbi:DNA-nicking endonuclease, Smr domain [Nitrosomonas cryotolerans]|uniref:DNA-nicking endonuclease, Smr domain n=1 Tax=Nitrosomonas cryotolerans ATCC 49181 TaxID=1131553 RepID=A0A1N6FVK9_9PROT|nr:Smr/MutS family protein [Nitrosomonas cryotolerans]SFP76200.1 DNA-nicking endonuclease, Smr domain [Nitrosomonas cryotolerans]SIN99366.1 DNA-nicking endonuclease, Smr domain [Nitrosomonas cryotolerans ATCC 49181]